LLAKLLLWDADEPAQQSLNDLCFQWATTASAVLQGVHLMTIHSNENTACSLWPGKLSVNDKKKIWIVFQNHCAEYPIANPNLREMR
jgi:hypothetical protein